MFLTAGSYPKESHRDTAEIRAEAEQVGGAGVRGSEPASLSGLIVPGGGCVCGGALPLPFRGFLGEGPATEAGGHPKGLS